ncbi:hypothetical protein [Mesorhizobium retamae]|uniref:DUF3310 domain-containing protein n=1 Tax=Mesorhizobium retamae TaxID=2912854 RepID=A0ABS9QJW0_9HYPH|nr:hypothetical protein [Mesorhizobium sp. IRAMC:0171]MCG7507103.1 hypothetical protein [Mesorhizobium sp. IRAMC:0171]
MTTTNINDLDAAWSPNPNGEWNEAYGRASCINKIATDTEPHILRNVAVYYRQKGATWADNMAGMLERFASREEEPANDNKPVGKQSGKPRNRRVA